MELLLAGVSHKSAPPEVREDLAAIGAAEALRRLQAAGWPEAVVLSTCNRFEVYAVAGSAGDSARLMEFLGRWSGKTLDGHAYGLSGAEAVRHLFGVASGLDSLVVGEAEILGQVKQAYEIALAAGSTGKLTNVLFQRALHTGKLVRGSTGISMGRMSVASVAVALAERIFGSLGESSVLILGAGEMAELAAKHLLSGKVAQLRLANRTWEKGRELAAKFRAEPVRWEDFPQFLETVDVVIASTGASRPALTREMVVAAFPARKGRSLFLIDIAMPRDVEPEVDGIDHVYLYTLQDLQGIVEENINRRRREIRAAEAMVLEKSSEFDVWLRSSAAGGQAALRHATRAVSEIPSPQ